MIEQKELIHSIQQFLPSKQRINNRLVSKAWNEASTMDTIWEYKMLIMKRVVLPNSYLVQQYSFKHENLRDHYLSESNKVHYLMSQYNKYKPDMYSRRREYVMDKYSCKLAEDTVNMWLSKSNE
jgi:hypothetical protein